MNVNLYTCLCISHTSLSQRLLKMPTNEIRNSSMGLTSPSEKRLLLLLQGKNCYVICLESVIFYNDYFNHMNHDCSNEFDGDCCIDFISYSDVNYLCNECLKKIIEYVNDYSIKVKKWGMFTAVVVFQIVCLDFPLMKLRKW